MAAMLMCHRKLGYTFFHHHISWLGYKTETLKQDTYKEILDLAHQIIAYYCLYPTKTEYPFP